MLKKNIVMQCKQIVAHVEWWRIPADEDGGTTISATLVPNPLGAMRLLRRSRAGGSAPSLGGRRHHHLDYTGAESSGRTYRS